MGRDALEGDGLKGLLAVNEERVDSVAEAGDRAGAAGPSTRTSSERATNSGEADDVVGHGSSGTIRAGDIPCAPFVSASELRACGDAAAGRLAGCDAYDGDRMALASVSN